MDDFLTQLAWLGLYAVPVVILVGIPVLIWQVRKGRRSAERRELEQLRREAGRG